MMTACAKPRLSRVALLVAVLAACCCPAAEIIFENPRFRAVLGENAVWQSLSDKASGDNLIGKTRLPFALATIGGKPVYLRRASLAGDRLTIELASADTRLVYRVTPADDWITFRLVEVAGTRPERLAMVRLVVTIGQHVGTRLGGAWNDRSAVSLMGINRQTDARATTRDGGAELAANTQDAPGPKLEGAGAALIVAPTSELRGILRRAAAAFDLPRNEAEGVPSKDLALARQSYWFLSFAEREVDQVIELCRQTGFRQVMLMSTSWCDSPGHYTFRTANYPDGIESLRRTVARLHEHGILVGMHSFASKVSKRDAYVTPVPDRRFLVDMTASLAGNIRAGETSIRTTGDLGQWPGSPVSKRTIWEGGVKKHQEVILDNEIVRYESIGPEGRWDTFLGCQRGAWGTRAAAHSAGTACRHYGVDGCIDGYIIDQETSLLDEVTTRLADVFNACGFEMVYFDGSEDVDQRRMSYYTSNFHAMAMSKFAKRPIIHQGGGFHHQVWHSFTRTGTADTYTNTLRGYLVAGGKLGRWPTVRDHIDRSVGRLRAAADDLIPAELGWFGIWPKGSDTDGLQLDEIEYLMAKSLAWDAPISLETSFQQMASHPLTPGILEIVGVYERFRLAGGVAEETRARLGEQGKDFVLYRAAQGDAPEFVAVDTLPQVAGTHDVRATVGARGRDTIAAVWHYLGKEGHLIFNATTVAACDIQGRAIPTETRDGKTLIRLSDRRTTLRFSGLGPDAVGKLLAGATFEPRKPVVLWIQAEEYAACAGAMAKGSAAAIVEKDAMGDVVLCAGPIDRSGKTSYCDYRVRIPHKGLWTLWGRVRYPGGGDMSFGLQVLGDGSTPLAEFVLGNCGVNQSQWHWTGQGGGVTSVPPGRPITLSLEAGDLAFRVYPREGTGRAPTNPRLDCLCLSDDPSYQPTDADVKAKADGQVLLLFSLPSAHSAHRSVSWTLPIRPASGESLRTSRGTSHSPARVTSGLPSTMPPPMNCGLVHLICVTGASG